MSKSFGEEAGKIIASAILATRQERARIVFKTNGRGEEVITINMPEILQKSHDFNKTLLDLGVLPSDVFAKVKSHKKTKKNLLAYIVYIDNNNIATVSDSELRGILNEADQDSKKISDVAPFIYNVFKTWATFVPELRKPRMVKEETVRGYLKLLEKYSHREILDMVLIYGKWAKAYYAMVAAEEFKPCWFPRADLDKLLISNKILQNHCEGGWHELVMAKNIPEEYAGKAEKIKKVSPAEIKKKLETQIAYQAEQGHTHGVHVIDPDFYATHKQAIDAKIEELSDAS